jgi:hypothetical protein
MTAPALHPVKGAWNLSSTSNGNTTQVTSLLTTDVGLKVIYFNGRESADYIGQDYMLTRMAVIAADATFSDVHSPFGLRSKKLRQPSTLDYGNRVTGLQLK